MPEPARLHAPASLRLRRPPHDGADGTEGAGVRPVVSVSAHDVPADAPPDDPVLLRDLLDEVTRARIRLEELLDRIAASEARIARTAMLVQERLHLGARMLHAFEGQISDLARLAAGTEHHRSELAGIDAALEERFATCKARVASALDGFEMRFRAVIESGLDEAIERVADLGPGGADERRATGPSQAESRK